MDIVASPDANLKAALHYAALGIKVFPIHGFFAGSCSCCQSPCPGTSKPGKHPACPHGCKDGTTDEAKTIEFFSGKPWLNVGIAPDEDVLVLDIDPRKGGSDTLARWEAEHGALPLTPKVKTGSDGFHYYFRLPPGVVVKNKAGELGTAKIVSPGVDTRSAGGYLVAPPSLHECGGRYEWLEPLTTPLALAPDWLVSIVAEKPTATATLHSPATTTLHSTASTKFVCSADQHHDFATHPGAAEGQRRKQCCRLAGIHVDRGDSLRSIEAMALAWAKRCDPPYAEAEALTHVRGIFAKEEAKRRELVSFPSPTSHVIASGRELAESQEAKPPSLPPLLSSPSPESEPGPMEADEGAALNAGEARIQEAVAIGSSGTLEPEEEADDWPMLSPEALYGLAGDIVQAVAPETEADPVGILLSLLTAFGNAVGRGPHFAISSGVHHANLFSAIVGDTASGKGQSWGVVNRLMAKAESEWAGVSIAYGLSSGEGLVERLKDEEEGEPAEKRLLCLETEFARPITAMRREGNTLSPIMRSAWDSQTLEVMTRGKSKLKASNAHVSIIANVTAEELQKIIGDSVEIANGFSNRFLWGLVRRSNILPEGGDPFALNPYVGPMAEAIAKAKSIGRVQRDDEAKGLWAGVYEELSTAKPGAFGKATSRGHAQTLRLSLLYALLDGSSVITASHLKAALALWRYCEHSARLIFGMGQEGTKEGREREQEASLDFRLLQAIEQTPGIKRSDLIQATASRKRGEVPDALASLQAMRLAHPRQCQSEGGGRPSECWFPGPGDEPGPKPGGMRFTCSASEEDGDDEGVAPLFATKSRTKVAIAIGSSEPSGFLPSDERREIGEGKETNSPGSGDAELISFPSQLPEARAVGIELPEDEPGELISFPSQLPGERAWDGNSDEPETKGIRSMDTLLGADARAVTFMENIYLKGMHPIEAFKAFGVGVKTVAEIEAESQGPEAEGVEPGVAPLNAAKPRSEMADAIGSGVRVGPEAEADTSGVSQMNTPEPEPEPGAKAEGVDALSPSPLLSSPGQEPGAESRAVEAAEFFSGLEPDVEPTPEVEVEVEVGEEEEMPSEHLEAVREWQRVLEARVKALLEGPGKVEQEDIPCLAPGWAEAAAKRLYRSAMRTAPAKGKPLQVPEGLRKGEMGLLEDSSLGWLHRTIQAGIERDAKAKALQAEAMPEEEFICELVASLEAIERSNADA